MKDSPRTIRPARLRGGFTFTEVMFAVMLLGIGFIMVAAIFPVAIGQSQANLEDQMGVIVAKAGGKVIENSGITFKDMTDDNIADDDTVYQVFRGSKVYNKIAGNMILHSDPRYAWCPIGIKLGPRRVKPGTPPVFLGSDYFDVYIVSMLSRIRPEYTDQGFNNDLAGFTFQSKKVTFFLTEGNESADTITFTDFKQLTKLVYPYEEVAAAEGTYVVVANDQVNQAAPPRTYGYPLNGRIYQLGAKREDKGPGVWELMPGKDMRIGLGRNALPDSANPSDPTNDDTNENLPPRNHWRQTLPPQNNERPAIGYLVGRGYVDPSNINNALEGPAQDLWAIPYRVPLNPQ